jgi:general secretion pathway protein D
MKHLLVCALVLSFNMVFAAEKVQKTISFEFKNAEITEVIGVYSKLSGQRFVIDPGVRGRVTILSKSSTLEQAYSSLLMALAVNGFSIADQGDFVRIGAARDIQKTESKVYLELPDISIERMITTVIYLKHMNAEEVNTRLRNLSSKFGDVSTVKDKNALIVSDFTSNVYRIRNILSELDRK